MQALCTTLEACLGTSAAHINLLNEKQTLACTLLANISLATTPQLANRRVHVSSRRNIQRQRELIARGALPPHNKPTSKNKLPLTTRRVVHKRGHVTNMACRVPFVLSKWAVVSHTTDLPPHMKLPTSSIVKPAEILPDSIRLLLSLFRWNNLT